LEKKRAGRKEKPLRRKPHNVNEGGRGLESRSGKFGGKKKVGENEKKSTQGGCPSGSPVVKERVGIQGGV